MINLQINLSSRDCLIFSLFDHISNILIPGIRNSHLSNCRGEEKEDMREDEEDANGDEEIANVILRFAIHE